MQRLDSFRKIISDSPGWQGVWQPDHPLLFRNPDYFLASSGRLIAGFIPTNYELGSRSALLSRITLARMALPVSTRYVLERASEITDHLVLSAVDEPIEGRSSEVKSIIARPMSKPNSAVSKFKKFWFQEYHLRMSAAALVFERMQTGVIDFSATTWITSSPQPEWMKTEFRNIEERPGPYGQTLAIVRSRNKSESQAVRQVCTSSLMYGNEIDRGLPHSLRKRIVSFVASTNQSVGDPAWVPRVIAFAGALPLPGGDSRLIDLAAEAYEEVLAR